MVLQSASGCSLLPPFHLKKNLNFSQCHQDFSFLTCSHLFLSCASFPIRINLLMPALFLDRSYVKLQSCSCFGCLFLLACFLTFLPVNWELSTQEVCSRRWIFLLKCEFVNPEMGAALGFPFQVSQR